MHCNDYPRFDFCLYQGEDKELLLALFSQDPEIGKTAMDLTGSTCEMVVRLEYTRKKIDQLTAANGRLTIGKLENGLFVEQDGGNVLRAVFTHEATTRMNFDYFIYDVMRIDPYGMREVVLHGKINVHRGRDCHA